MSGYQRFISYVYEYHKGKKENSYGFIKVEVRSMRCKLELHLRCPGLMPYVKRSLYGIVRSEGLINGIFLGSLKTGKNITECVLETEALDMNHSSVSFEQLGGIVLKTENGAFFGTEWDDQPIRPEDFREISFLKGNANREEKELHTQAAELPEEKKHLESAACVVCPKRGCFQEQGMCFSEAFSDGTLEEEYKIQLKGFDCLDQKDQILCNNRFLLYGFYSFGHILLGKKTDGSYILGGAWKVRSAGADYGKYVWLPIL